MRLIKQNFPHILCLGILIALVQKISCAIPLSSVYCPANAGTGASFNSCQSCDQVFALNNSASPNCQPNPPDMHVYEASSSSGLTMVYSTNVQTLCGSITNIDGWLSMSDTLTVRYPGVTRPYQGIKILFGLVTRGSWAGPEMLEIRFANNGDLRSQSVYTRNIDLLGQCSPDNTDFYYRVVINHAYTTQSTELVWNVGWSGISGSTNGQWGITEVLLLLRACDQRCIVCTTSTITCTSCTTSGAYQSFLITSTSRCVAAPDCPTATYAATSTHVCESCNSTNCVKCSTINVCTQCAASFYLHAVTASCYGTCPVGYYGDAGLTPPACTGCPSQCTACSSASSCSACTTSGASEAFLSGTSCVAAASCLAGTYPETATHVCTACNTSCSTCSLTLNNCTACASGLYYLSNVCYSTCPTGYYANTGTGLCTLCDAKCTACAISSTYCSACTTSGASQSFLISSTFSCVAAASCPSGSYPETATHICTACNTSCSTCSLTVNNCTACTATLFYLSNVCYSTCPTGYYGNTGTGLCTLCDVKCTQCSSASSCSACTTSGASEAFLSGTSCVVAASCPAGTYPETATHVCTACNTSCSTCSLTVNNCTACATGLYYMANVCYSTCPTGYYANTGTGLCTICDAKCTACAISSTNCSACTTSGASESFLIASSFSCVTAASCPSGSYPEPTTHICTACNTSCATCQSTLNNCTSCILGLFYLSNICYTDCPLGYYQSAPAIKQCLVCNSLCAACDVVATNCSACVTSGANQAFLSGTACVVAASCPAGTYPQTATHVCTACNTSCATCQSTINNCTSCILGLFYLSNICYTDCPLGYYQSTPALKQCLTCNPRCSACDISSTNCSACTISGPSESYLNTSTNSCVILSSCAAGYFGNALTHICQACNISCSTCTGTTNNCTWCKTPLYLLNNVCYTTCPVTYYGNAGVCILCNSLCATCTGTLVSQCLSCQTTAPNQAFYLAANKTCYVTCPVGYFPIVATHICQKCDISCSACTGSPSPCSACNSSYAFYNSTCLAACPAGFYAAPSPPLTYKVCTPCVQACLTCYGGTDATCYTCNFDMMVKKSGSYCRINCLPGWGDIDNSQYCTYCNPRCVSCFNNGNNCTACKTSGTNEGFMIITDLTYNTGNCYGVCPAGYFGNTTTHFCNTCTSPCKNCSKNSNNCTACVNGTYYLNFSCYAVCPDGYFINGTVCSPCAVQCKLCSGDSDNCTLCKSSLPTFLYNLTCLYSCPSGFYKSPSPTLNYTCQQCNPACKTCTGDPSPCQSCSPNYFFYLNTCNTTCYQLGYFGDIVTWRCLACDSFCVRLGLTMGFESVLDQAVVVTFTFSEELDWTVFPMADFQEFSFSDPFFTVDMFSFQFTILSGNSYQIRITPKLYIFMYNLGLTVTVMPMPQPNLQAKNKRPFHETVYNQTETIVWSHIKAPGVTDQEKQVIIQMMNVTAQLQRFTNLTGVREIVQSGVFAWIFPGVQITSAVILVNGIMPQHMYEGIRIMATSIFYQVPSWEKNAENSRYVLGNSIQDLIEKTLNTYLSFQFFNTTIDQDQSLSPSASPSRNLAQQAPINMPSEWRFKRTGFSTFFVLDLYMQIIFLTVVWILLAIFTKCIYKRDFTHPNVRKMFTVFHKIHEISLMYVTIALVLEWLYFQKQAENGYKWISFIVCLLLLVYFLLYELYIYYDMFQYPEAHVNTRSYLMYATKYGSFLNKIRYQEYDINEEWSPRVWFRPYNYHILSFYKKFMMIFALPIFHELPYTQASCLILLQILQLLRFILTWPFNSKLRNLYRIFLQLLLLLIFTIVLLTQHLSTLLMKNDPTNIEEVAKWFNLLGWIGLVLVLVFNISVFVITAIDLGRLCWKGDSVVQMDQIRKRYYWEKVRRYEDENQDINVNVVSKWVKLGNLREEEQMHEEAKFITVKVEKLKLEKTSDFFTVHITHVTQLRIKKEGFIYEQNSRRLQIKDKVRKFMQISKESNPQFFQIFKKLYETHKIDSQFLKAKQEQKTNLFEKPRFKDSLQVIVQTYLRINLNEYPDGGRVYFYKSMIRHVISLYLNENKIGKIKVQERIQGLPLSNKILEESYRKDRGDRRDEDGENDQ